MKRKAMWIVLVAIAVGLAWTSVAAQPMIDENHYLVYEVPQFPVFSGDIGLFDQFNLNGFFTTVVELDKFANPVEKNGEVVLFPDIHQTWWRIDEPQPVKLVNIDNQFGRQDSLIVKDGHYLVLPALKDVQPPVPPVPVHNHYKCYDIISMPPLMIPVVLTDQFFPDVDAMVMEPVQFCNPVVKDVNGQQFPIEDPFAHLTCYRLSFPPFPPRDLMAIDQFGDRLLTVEEAVWLCVPTEKLVWVPNELRTWGNVKSMYKE